MCERCLLWAGIIPCVSVVLPLLNTRGLIELVILNIGLEAGVLSPAAFSMFVVKALVTTFMTSPLV